MCLLTGVPKVPGEIGKVWFIPFMLTECTIVTMIALEQEGKVVHLLAVPFEV